MASLGEAFLQSELKFVGPAPPLDAIEPLPCDRWLASSALQKSIRRGDALTAQRGLKTLYGHDPRSAWRRLLCIACEDIGIGALSAVFATAMGSANPKARRAPAGDEAAALATAQMLAEAPKERSADMLYTAAQHDPALSNMRARRRSVAVARRLEFVADPTLSLPERALAAWHASGVNPHRGQRVGPGDLAGLMRAYKELGVPEPLLEAIAVATRTTREPITLMLPLLWLTAAGGETGLVDLPLAPSILVSGVPLYALDKHTRLGRQALARFARESAEIAQFLSAHRLSFSGGALGVAVFYAEGALTRPTLRWRQSAELTAIGVAADFHGVNVPAGVGETLVWLVRAHIVHLNAIRTRLLCGALNA